MRKKISLGTAISIMFLAMTLTFCVTMLLSTRMFESRVESVSQKESMYDKISDIESTVRQNYYSTIEQDKILNALSAGYMNGLGDSEARYYTPDEVIEYQQVAEGKIIGVGVEFAKSRENAGYMYVYKVYSESPADVQGIQAGDLITAINGASTANLSAETVKNMLSGIAGESVDITYMRDSAETTVTVVHRAFDLPEISYSKEEDCGYIKISTFATGTASSLEYAVNNLISQNVKSLVIDLRDNSSKDFDVAAEAADILIPEGTTMYALYKDGERKVRYTSDKTSVSLPVVVITNSGTSYAAEMFAMMMKDSMGGKIVGTSTAGKGAMQKLYRLPDGSGVQFTIAVLSPVSSDAYNGTGILPDYEKQLEGTSETYLLSISDDPQIQRAFEVADNLAGKTVVEEQPQTGETAEGEADTETNDSPSEAEADDSSSNEEAE